MFEFIAKYWIEWLLGLIALGLAAVAKYFHALYQKDKKRQLQDHDKEFQDQVEQVRQGLLKGEKEMLTNAKTEMSEEIKHKEQELIAQIQKYQAESIARDQEVLEKLANHTKEADEKYERMFTSLTKQVDGLQKISEDADTKLTAEISQMVQYMSLVKEGTLSIQGKDFKSACKELLKPDRVISTEDFEEISEAHAVYNKLGGNHNGDCLFQLVEEKYKKTL